MRFRKELMVIALVVFVTLLLGVTMGSSAFATDCTVAAFQALGLKDVQFSQPVTFTSALVVAASGSTPAYCDVKATLWPEIVFEIKMPVAVSWNGKLFYNGGGGWDGSIPDLSTGLILGYASAGTNGGHKSSFPPGLEFLDGSFGYNPPNNSNPNYLQKRQDFGYRAAYEGSTFAKKVITAYYGSGPKYSYWVGCSNGGRGAMMMSQRYPEVFDGYVAGAPHFSYMGTTQRGMWDSQVAAGIQNPAEALVPLSITDQNAYMTYAATKLKTLSDAIYNKCDTLDGLADGVIDDPTKCDFDPAKDLLACPGDVDASTCFTKGQVNALEKVYGGIKNSAGTVLYPGTALGAEIAGPGLFGNGSLWFGSVVSMSPGAPADILGSPMYQYIAFDPAPGPTWNFTMFNFDTDPQRAAATGILEVMDALNPDLSWVKNKGAKIIHWHGWSDALVTPIYSVERYNVIKAAMDAQLSDIDSFYKLYMVPGVSHCGGGTGWGVVDWVTPLVNWVEKGIEPGALIGTRPANPNFGWTTTRTRPVCPYPQVARYLGTGSIDDGANFTCVEIIPATVRIAPETLKLSKKGTIRASMTSPELSSVKHGEISTVVCEGALAKGTPVKLGHSIRASFNIEDLINITAGEPVTFTVTAIFEQNGQQFAFEGSDTVKVTE